MSGIKIFCDDENECEPIQNRQRAKDFIQNRVPLTPVKDNIRRNLKTPKSSGLSEKSSIKNVDKFDVAIETANRTSDNLQKDFHDIKPDLLTMHGSKIVLLSNLCPDMRNSFAHAVIFCKTFVFSSLIAFED